MSTKGQPRSTGREPSFAEKRQGDFWINALIGAVATFVIGALPLVQFLAPIGGGAVAGYLQNTGTGGGLKVGAVAGLIGSIPAILIGILVLGFFGIFGAAGAGAEGLLGGGLIGGFFLVFILIAVAISTAASAVGGAIGAMMAED
ncbi:hypothetical protein BRD00_01745 [Halobacteriales archaeon QS_8_69_26]|nr:MAG: hypothetical protein BRD00_01745 [Halobacteriales archaeon QS_8_69_26]